MDRCKGRWQREGWCRGGYGALENLGDLDVGIGEVGAVGERRDGLVGFFLEEGKHVGCGLSEVLIGADLGEGDGVREPINGERVADAEGAGNVALVASVVLPGGTNVPPVDTMGCHVGALIGRDVDHNASAGRGEGAAVEVKISIEASVGGEPGLPAGGTQKVECEVSLRHEKVPFGEREFGVASGKARAEMVLPGLDRALGGVATMAVWGNALEVHIVFAESFLELVRALVVEDVETRRVAVRL